VYHREQRLSSSKTACVLNISDVVKLWGCKRCVFRFVLSLLESVKLTKCTSCWNTCRNTLRNIVIVVYKTGHCQHALEALEPTFRRFRKIAKNDNLLRYVSVSGCLSVRPSAWNNSAPTERISLNFICNFISEICRESSIFIKNEKHNGYFVRRTIYIYDSISLNFS
jgi:hypothetical protein